MPTEQEFEEAKVRFFIAADDAEELLRPTRQAMGPDVLKGGRLTEAVKNFIDSTGGRLGSVAEALRELGRECRKRAEECRQAAAARDAYEAALTDHRAAAAEHVDRAAERLLDPTLPDPGPAPTAPTPPPAPPPYVEI